MIRCKKDFIDVEVARNRKLILVICFLFISIFLYGTDVPQPEGETANKGGTESVLIPKLEEFSLLGYPCEIVSLKGDRSGYDFEIIGKIPGCGTISSVIPVFKTTKDSALFIGEIEQKSNESEIDLSEPIVYEVVGPDGERQSYTLKIKNLSNFTSDLEINVHPAYNTDYEMVNIGTDLALFMGGTTKWGELGLEFMGDYYLFNGEHHDTDLTGYWLTLRAVPTFRFNTSPKWDVHSGLGFSWIQSPFEYGTTQLYNRSDTGLFAQLDINYYLLPSLRLDFSSQIDLFTESDWADSFDSLDHWSPYIKTGLKPTLLKKDSFWELFCGMSWLYYGYDGSQMNTEISMVTVDVGGRFKFKTRRKPKLKQEIPNPSPAETSPAEKDRGFPCLYFEDGSNQLTEESIHDLEETARILLEKADMSISLELQTTLLEDPVFLMTEVENKTEEIKKLFEEKGISRERIITFSEISIIGSDEMEDRFRVQVLGLE
ncbi:MAG: hypothetical protein PQJ59_18550 [Spirochaetales bacterium]|nr:hypothetical protein [Spirochaetales bacterium]